jgi:hypothetical protein
MARGDVSPFDSREAIVSGLGYPLPFDPNEEYPSHYGRGAAFHITIEDMNPATARR